jgi:predicted GNAT family acetyltransferase
MVMFPYTNKIRYNFPMKIIIPDDANEFLGLCAGALEDNEVAGNLIFGLANKLARNKNAYSDENPFYSVVYNNGEISLIALMTPPKNLLLYEYKNLSDEVINTFAENLLRICAKIPGVTGDLKIANSFAEKWTALANCKSSVSRNMRIYKLTKVNDYKRPAGTFRPAEKKDAATIEKFLIAFAADTNEYFANAREEAEEGIANGNYFVWEDGEVVSMARKQRPSRNGMSIGPVYTPDRYRGKGYATATVAELSKDILKSGKKFCTLFTDLANPVSNGIYQKIGYTPVSDSISYSFEY